MIRTLLVPLPFDPRNLNAQLNKLLDEGYVPLSSCWIPATNGPGGVLYTLGKTSDGAADTSGEHKGNGTADTLRQPEVIGNDGQPAQ